MRLFITGNPNDHWSPALVSFFSQQKNCCEHRIQLVQLILRCDFLQRSFEQKRFFPWSIRAVRWTKNPSCFILIKMILAICTTQHNGLSVLTIKCNFLGSLCSGQAKFSGSVLDSGGITAFRWTKSDLPVWTFKYQSGNLSYCLVGNPLYKLVAMSDFHYRHEKLFCLTHWSTKEFFFQKARSVWSILGYTEVAEPEYALSFFKMALVFEIYRNHVFRISAYW